MLPSSRLCRLMLGLSLAFLASCTSAPVSPYRTENVDRLRIDRMEEELARLREDAQRLLLSSTQQSVRLAVLSRSLEGLNRSANAWHRHQIQQEIFSLEADRTLLEARREHLAKALIELDESSGADETVSHIGLTRR